METEMKVLIISDIHYAMETAKSAIDANRDAEYVLFLGDGLDLMEKISLLYPTVGFISVKGNCDFCYPEIPLSKTVMLGGVKIFMCHGHKLSVKSDYSAVISAASKENADIVLYGHTHRPSKGECIFPGGKTAVLFNPGSLGEPRGGSKYSYGILDITEENGKPSFNLRHISL